MNYLELLKMRFYRLLKEIDMNAPKIIIDTELRLINEACNKILESKKY